MVMNRTQFKEQLELGLNASFGMAYDEHPQEWSELFETVRATKAVEYQVQEMGLGVGRVKPEGAGVAYDEGRELWVSRFFVNTYALAFAITEEAEEDGLYGDIGRKYSKSLARAMRVAKEIEGAAILNNGFDANFPGGDGTELLATDHTKGIGGTWSNELATPADVSETSLETIAIQINNETDDRGVKIMLRPKKLVVPPDSEFIVERILGGSERPNTANRDINALHKRGTIPDWCINHYLTDTDSWFVLTDADGGLQHFKRKPLRRGIEGDFETGNMRYKARERYVFGWHDPRGVYGSPGN